MKQILVSIALLCLSLSAAGQAELPVSIIAKVRHLAESYPQLANRRVACLVDYSLPSYEKRLWIVDLPTGRTLLHTWVAHGRGTGRTAEASVFSNAVNSFCSSLGVFIPQRQFNGKHGLSLRLTGLDRGVNDNAELRGIIFHAAPYVTPHNAVVNRRQGNSQGCFAVPDSDIPTVVQLLEDTGAFVWAFQTRPADTNATLLTASK